MSEAAFILPFAAICGGILSYLIAVMRDCGKFISARLDFACTFALAVALMVFYRSGLTNLESFALGVGTVFNICISTYLLLRIRGKIGHEWSDTDQRHLVYLSTMPRYNGLRRTTDVQRQVNGVPKLSGVPLAPKTKQFCYEDIRRDCERDHWGDFVVIEPTSGAYHFAKTSLEAAQIALKMYDGRPSEVVRIGEQSRISGISVQ
jgi:hypothetical protein